MVGPHPRTPTPDRQNRDIDTSSELPHPGKDSGIPGEIDARGTLQDVPERFPPAAAGITTPIVYRRDGLDEHAGHRESIANTDLDDFPNATTPEDPAASAGHDHRASTGDHAQRGHVQVVVVGVRDDDDVRLEPVDVRHRRSALDVRDPRPQQWIGEHSGPGEFHQGRGVADVGDRDRDPNSLRSSAGVRSGLTIRPTGLQIIRR